MKKIEFEVAMNHFGDFYASGFKEVDGQKSELFKWESFNFYFAQDKVFISGDIPLALGYRLFLHFSGNKTISFLDDDANHNRVYSVGSLKTLLEFIFIIRSYQKKDTIDESINYAFKESSDAYVEVRHKAYVKAAYKMRSRKEIPLIPDLDYGCKLYERLKNILGDLKSILKLKFFKETPKLPKNCYYRCSPQQKWLLENIQSFNRNMTRLERSKLQLEDLLMAMLCLDVDFDIEEEMGTIKIKNPDDFGESVYVYSKDGIVYDFLYQIDELKYVRTRFICSYGNSIKLPKLWVEITPVITPRTIGPTKSTIIYDLLENRMYREGSWIEPTENDYTEMSANIAYANIKLEETINFIFQQQNRPMSFKPKKK